jgi:hypothetical protein
LDLDIDRQHTMNLLNADWISVAASSSPTGVSSTPFP